MAVHNLVIMLATRQQLKQYLVPTPPELAFTVYKQPTLCSLQGIGSGQRQLIAVTCIAEHA